MLTWQILFLAFVECKKNDYKQFLKAKKKKTQQQQNLSEQH